MEPRQVFSKSATTQSLSHHFEFPKRDQCCPVIVDSTRCISFLFLELSVIFAVFDLSSRVALSHFPLAATRQGLAHAQRSLRLLPTDRLPTQTRVRPLRRSLSRQSKNPPLLLFRSIPLHGLRSTDLAREPARHRNLSSCPSQETLSRGISRRHRWEHARRCQRTPRLAHLRRLRSG